ncbi:MAG TPA: ABC transporter permease [Firmicutes bacterium]|nr:ABC transporter permease [Bacillota bacterium]
MAHQERSSDDYRRAWRKFKKNKAALIGLAIICLLFITAVFAPLLAPFDPTDLDLTNRYNSPNRTNLLGTDEFGRDVLSRIIYGSRIVVGVSFSATMLAAIFGITLGLLAGYFGGVLDAVISRAADIMLAFPAFLLAIALVAVFGANTFNIIIIIAVTRTPRYARLVRGSVLSVKAKEYVEATDAVGASTPRILFKHILPNCIGPVMVYASLTLGDSILTVAGLSFLGLGVQPPTADWGVMLSRGKEYMLLAPWMAIIPGIAIVLTVMGFNLLGDGLRDLIDPRD